MNIATMPRPTDGPEFHRDFSAWVDREVQTIDDAIAVLLNHLETTNHGEGCACVDPVFRKLRRRYAFHPHHLRQLSLIARRMEAW